MTAADALRVSLEELATALESFQFRLPGPGQEGKERGRIELVRSMREYVVPRLKDPDAPVVAVLVGPTGSGKSVVMNSLAGMLASKPGALRPTTRAPVVWAHRTTAQRYKTGFLSSLRRDELTLVTSRDPLTEQLTIIDAPDFESVYSDSRVMGEEVLAVADLCIFVASALRYADAAAWQFLDQVRRRGLPILFVLNRLGPDPENRKLILSDFASLLKNRDLLLEADASLIFDVSEQVVNPRQGALEADAVAGIRRELSLISDPALRRQVVRQSTEGAVAEAIERVGRIASDIEKDRSTVSSLRKAAEHAYGRELETCAGLVKEGRLVSVTGQSQSPTLVRELASALSRRAGVAARDAAAAWDSVAEGRGLLAMAETLWRHGPATPEVATREATKWLEGIEASLSDSVRRSGRRRAIATEVAHSVLDGRSHISSLPEQDQTTRIVASATEALEAHLAAVLASDAERFQELTAHVDHPQEVAPTITSLAEKVSARAGEFYR